MSPGAKVALITGGAKRVGRAIASELAGAGFDIAISYLSSQRDAQKLVDEVQARGRRATAIQADLTDPESAAQVLFDAINTTFGRLDVLVNNASLYKPATLALTSLPMIRQMMAVHYEAPLLLAQRFETMLRTARGHVVSMSDLLASRPWPAYLAYCGSKAALSNLTIALAKELAPQVSVNAIAPGVVEWPDDYPQAQRDEYLKRVPLARAGRPQDVARLVRFLVTDGQYITGQVIPLDGGRSIT